MQVQPAVTNLRGFNISILTEDLPWNFVLECADNDFKETDSEEVSLLRQVLFGIRKTSSWEALGELQNKLIEYLQLLYIAGFLKEATKKFDKKSYKAHLEFLKIGLNSKLGLSSEKEGQSTDPEKRFLIYWIQNVLGIPVTSIYDLRTWYAVKKWQSDNKKSLDLSSVSPITEQLLDFFIPWEKLGINDKLQSILTRPVETDYQKQLQQAVKEINESLKFGKKKFLEGVKITYSNKENMKNQAMINPENHNEILIGKMSLERMKSLIIHERVALLAGLPERDKLFITGVHDFALMAEVLFNNVTDITISELFQRAKTADYPLHKKLLKEAIAFIRDCRLGKKKHNEILEGRMSFKWGVFDKEELCFEYKILCKFVGKIKNWTTKGEFELHHID